MLHNCTEELRRHLKCAGGDHASQIRPLLTLYEAHCVTCPLFLGSSTASESSKPSKDFRQCNHTGCHHHCGIVPSQGPISQALTIVTGHCATSVGPAIPAKRNRLQLPLTPCTAELVLTWLPLGCSRHRPQPSPWSPSCQRTTWLPCTAWLNSSCSQATGCPWNIQAVDGEYALAEGRNWVQKPHQKHRKTTSHP